MLLAQVDIPAFTRLNFERSVFSVKCGVIELARNGISKKIKFF